MAKPDHHPKKLLVEGIRDRLVIPQLIEKNGITWGKTAKESVVFIEDCGGYENINSDFIFTELQATKLTHLGIIIDADYNADTRWQSIRNACLFSIPDIPQKIPETGLIHTTNTNIKFGIWIMPDNQTRGMLETFLAYMVPDQDEPLWQYAQEIIAEAKNRGAPFKDFHFDKAYIYSWLAWQDEPGRQLHQAVQEKILDPQHPKAQVFVNWFKSLYDL